MLSINIIMINPTITAIEPNFLSFSSLKNSGMSSLTITYIIEPAAKAIIKGKYKGIFLKIKPIKAPKGSARPVKAVIKIIFTLLYFNFIRLKATADPSGTFCKAIPKARAKAAEKQS